MKNFQNSNSYLSLPDLFIQKRGMLMYLILGIALVAFEAINFSTTQYALQDLLGPVTFASIQWATILSVAFCGIDFAGIAKLFTPDSDQDDRSREVWFLFLAWILAATLNAMLTWWGVSMALAQHTIRSTEIIDKKLILQAVPVIVAIMIWVTRVLLIGSFSRAGRGSAQAARSEMDQATWERIREQRQRALAAAERAHRVEPEPQPIFEPPQAAPQPTFKRPQPPALPTFRRPPSTIPAAPLSTARPQPTPAAPRPAPGPRAVEPEYIPDGEDESSSPLPSLRPLTAISARSGRSGEKRF
jgi:hypothetical protein